MHNSLRRQLLLWVLMPLTCAIGLNAWLTYQSSATTAAVVQDQLLLGSARMIAQQISFEDGAFQVQIPPAALELFQTKEVDRVFYRVTTGDGQLLAGYTEMLLPHPPSRDGSPQFFASTMRGAAVRVAAYFQPVIGSPSAQPVVVEVAQTTQARSQLTQKLWLRAVAEQIAILILTFVFILFGLHRGLRPLIRLRDDIRARDEGSLQPLRTDRLPSELTPMVEAFNDYIQRLETHTNRRARFIQNAAHQLRTPLAVLGTQVSDALRADTKAQSAAPLTAARRTLQQTTRLVNQFLALSSAEAYLAQRSPTSTQRCCEVVQAVLEDLAALAHSKSIDLGFERIGSDTVVQTDPLALQEMAMNVIDNAIRYTPAHGRVTVRVASAPGAIELVVEDNGPGVPAPDHERIFERFVRLSDQDSHGSGLGLAIVKELAVQCGALIRVDRPAPPAHGFVLSMVLCDLDDGKRA